ncbi:hypothetical protein C1192_11575 [Escherichia marmotae]|nr:hypothetical protein C1192_11575 [Escherichia marmotae]
MAKTTKSFLALLRGGNLGVPLVILCILAMIILPLPPALLDILFTFNIVLAVMVLLVAVSAKRPLEFSLFPTILLITTLAPDAQRRLYARGAAARASRRRCGG